ncbi:MAG TPA: tetratricopeptide repeat protein, partial [Candidatus Eremiobacteraceae bacterium]|nr:tetratricopeptide repeat protein [Candidatus Eremiobacteraceae bacterium]
SALNELRAEGLAPTIALRPLSLDAVERIVARLPIADADRARIARVGFERSEGNPLFLTEALRDGPDKWRGGEALASLVGARLAALSENGRDIAELAAVIGHGFRVDLIRDVAGVDESRVLDGVYELMDAHLVREAGARGRHDFVFTHHLIHEAIYESIDAAARARRHRRIAGIVEERFGTDPSAAADLALQRERGGDPIGAADAYVAAARYATELFANDDAIRQATRALALTNDDRVRAQALLIRELALGRAARRDEQAADIEALRSLAVSLDDDDLSWETLRRKMHLDRGLADVSAHAAAVAEMEARAAGSDDERRRAEALLARADQLVLITSHAQAEEPALRALDLYEQIGDGRGQIEALALLAQIATVAGDFDGTRRFLSSLRKRTASLADKSLALRAISTATVTALQRYQIQEAGELAREGLTLARAIGDREEEADTLQRLAIVLTWQSDFDLSRRTFAEAAAAMEAIGNARGLSHALANEFVLSMRLGLLQHASRLGERALALIEKTGELRPLVVTKVNMSLNNLLGGDAAEARRLGIESLGLARQIKFPLFEGAALSNLGNAERALGDIEAGLKHLEEGLEIRRRLLEPADVLDDLCDLAVAYVQAGQTDRAVETAEELLRSAEQSTAGAFWPHYCWWAGAIVRRSTGDVQASDALLSRSFTVMDEFASRIADERTRAAFLALPLCVDVTAAVELARWPAHAGGATARYSSSKKRKRQAGGRHPPR